MEHALRLVARVGRSGRGGALVITGERGIGKTTVLEAVGVQARRSGFRVATANADLAGQVSPGAPVLLALRSGTDPILSSDELTELAGLVAAPLLLIDRIAGRLDDLATSTPLLVAIDNAGAVDRLSRFALQALSARLADRPVLWLVTADEDDESARDLLAGADTEVLRLGPLACPDVAAVARDRLGAAPRSGLRRLIERVDGNPALLSLVLDGAAAGLPDQAPLPAGFVVGIQRALCRLEPPVQTMVRVVAEFGRPVALADLGTLLDSAGDVLSWAEAGVRAGLLRERNGHVLLRHGLIREAIAAGADERRQNAVRLRCARHLLDAGDSPAEAARLAAPAAAAGDAEAVRLLRRAAAELAGSDPAAAAAFMLRAFRGVAVHDPDWFDVGEQCLEMLVHGEHATEAIRVADLLIGRAGEPQVRARVQAASARAYWLAGRATDGMNRLGPAGVEPAGPLRVARALLEGRAESTSPAAPLASCADRVIVAQSRAEEATSRGDHRAALAHAREAGDVLLGHEILSLQALDRHDEAGILLDSAGDNTDRLPSLGHARLAQAFELSRLDEADRLAVALITRSTELGDHRYGVAASAVQVATALVRGDVRQARERLIRAESSTLADASVRQPALTVVRGWLLAAEGHRDDAVTVLSSVLPAVEEPCAGWLWTPGWMRLFVHVGLAAGDERLAGRAVEIAELAAARNPGVPGLEGTAVQLRGVLEGDLDVVARGAELLERTPRPVLRAGGHEDHGRLLLAAGRRSEGVAELDRAWDIYQSVGAQPKIEGLRRELRGLGIRRPRSASAPRVVSGWGALSEAEVRVARLIAAGHSNRLAARELGLSANTIGSHLRSIFTKLEIQSRVQLANLVHEQAASHQFT